MRRTFQAAARRWLRRLAGRSIEGNEFSVTAAAAPASNSPRIQFAQLVIEQLVAKEDFETVLDIGSGAGEHASYFLSHGKQVTAIDLGNSPYFAKRDDHINVLIGNFNEVIFPQQYDCVWASHVLEHQPNVQLFLGRIHAVLREGGVLAITMPPLKHEIVGGT